MTIRMSGLSYCRTTPTYAKGQSTTDTYNIRHNLEGVYASQRTSGLVASHNINRSRSISWQWIVRLAVLCILLLLAETVREPKNFKHVTDSTHSDIETNTL